MGAHTFKVGFSDGVNPETLSTEQLITVAPIVDTIPPTRPTISNSEVINFNQFKIDWTLSASDTDITTINVKKDGVIVQSIRRSDVVGNAFTYTSPVLPDGTYSYTIEVTDGTNTVLSSAAVVTIADFPVVTEVNAFRIPSTSRVAVVPIATPAGRPIQEFVIRDKHNNVTSVLGTMLAGQVPFLTDFLATGNHEILVEAVDQGGKISTTVTSSVVIPVPTVNAGTATYTYVAKTNSPQSGGIAVTLNWTTSPNVLVDTSIVVLKSVGTQYNGNPNLGLPAGVEEIIVPSGVSSYSEFLKEGRPVYYRVYAKSGNSYGYSSSTATINPSNWYEVPDADKRFWGNNVDPNNPAISYLTTDKSRVKMFYVTSEIPAADLAGSAVMRIVYTPFEVTANLDVKQKFLTNIVGNTPLVVRQAVADPLFAAGTSFSLNPVAPNTPEVGQTYWVGVRKSDGTNVFQYQFTPTRESDVVPPLSGVYHSYGNTAARNPSLRGSVTIMENGTVEVAGASRKPIFGVIKYRTKQDGEIVVYDTNGSIAATYSFNLYFQSDIQKWGFNLFVRGNKYENQQYQEYSPVP